MKRILIAFGILTAIATAASAETFVVGPDSLGGIQLALDLANPGDTVELLDGVYDGPENRNLNFNGKDLILRSQNDNPEACIIDCEGDTAPPETNRNGIVFNSGETFASLVRGITIYDARGGAGP